MAGAMDGVREYLRTVRKEKDVRQRELAEVAGISLRAFQDWEAGKTDDLKGSLLIRIMSYLQVPFEHIRLLTESSATPDEGHQLAEQWLQGVLDSNDPVSEADILDVIDEMQAEMDRLRKRIQR